MISLGFVAWRARRPASPLSPQPLQLRDVVVAAARHGWMTDMPKRLTRRCGWVTVAASIALVVLLAVELEPGEDLATRADWPTLVFALLYGLIAVTWSLFFVGWLQHAWSKHGDMVGTAANASYATYFVHPLVLTLVMLLCKPLPLLPEFKFVQVAGVAIPACFIVGHSLKRLPGTSRVL